jgi:hypothetical protein
MFLALPTRGDHQPDPQEAKMIDAYYRQIGVAPTRPVPVLEE